jgi:adenine-specific DNA-methyltransferase
MNLKHAILQVMKRDDLKAAAVEMGLDGIRRQTVPELTAALSRSRQATAEFLLSRCGEEQVKAVCNLVGVDPAGRRQLLVARLRHHNGQPRRVSRDGRRQAHLRPRKEATTMRLNEDSRDVADEAGERPARLREAPHGMFRVTKTELVWPGKYNEDGTLKEGPRVSLPFQVIERINESRATRETKKAPQMTLFDVYEGKEGQTFEEGWRNKLIWGDNLLVLGPLLEKFAGKVDLIYIDPPFHAGADFSFKAQMGELTIEKEASLLEEKAYRDTWGGGMSTYLEMMRPRLMLAHALLSPTGSLYIHLDHNVSHYIKVLLDDLFGRDNFRNEIIWQRTSARSDSKTYNHIHDTIFLYTHSDRWKWNRQHTEYDADYVENFYRYQDEKGRFMTDNLTAAGTRKGSSGLSWRGVNPTSKGRHWAVPAMIRALLPDPSEADTLKVLDALDSQGYIHWPEKEDGMPRIKRYLDDMPGAVLQSIWTDIGPVSAHSAERTGYDTQKPEGLLERIVKSSSNPGDLILDFFCGSGTTLAVAEKEGRRWIGCDLSRFAMHVSRKRLLGIDGCHPFEILNLGKYERQYWQGITFGEQANEQALYEYLAFILKLYGAQPVAGLVHLHGKKGRAMVHIGAVDAPITIDEINSAVEECVKLKQPELHVLGWEWEMGLYDLMTTEAKKKGVKLLLLQIPREVMEQQAVDKGDIRFFELAYLQVEIKLPKKLTAAVTLMDFVIPNTELIPQDVRSKVKKWSDYIDYWAVDWDFQNDTFMQGWVTYRTRKDRTLALTSDAHTYEKAGKYRVLVKVVDIFGNDTSEAYDLEVR